MNLSQLYDYVFGERAILQLDEARLTKALRRQSKPDDEIKKAIEAIKERKQNAIRNVFAFLSDPVNNNPLRSSFLALLSSLQTPSADALKNILYGDEKPSVVLLHGYDDEEIKEKFSVLNQQFDYFSGDKATQAQKDFVVFYKACKLNADFIECNNDPDNSLASDLAYKMLVVFGAAHKNQQSVFADVNAYLRQHGQGDKPVHDALVQSIPVNDPPLQDLDGWRKFIQKYGAKGLEFFQEAPDIERLLNGKAPETKKEAEQAASQLSYPRANEYPKLARLCKQYHLNEKTFNRCLEIEKGRKSSDKLPNISVDGSEIGHAGYHLLKLPIDDPRAYVLGHITNCCQSMGGHSEQCVIDGITRDNNGFYVLLKGKPDATPLKQNGHINYKDFRMVGQGYAWLSKKGNLVFDSWECLMPGQHDKVIVSLLQKFAEKATGQETEILRVTIGRGGKTPAAFKQKATLGARSEKMMEGVQYGDSVEQSLAYINEVKLNQAKSALQDKWDELKAPLWQTKEAFKAWLNSYSLSSLHDAGVIEELFLNQATADVWKNTEIKDWVISTSPQMPELLDVLHLLYQHKLLTEDNVKSLKSIETLKSFLDCFLDSFSNLISDKNFKLLAEHAAYAKDIDYALRTMHKADPTLVNDENFKLLANHAAHTKDIGSGLSALHKADPVLMTNENFKLLANHAAHARSIGYVLLTLHEADKALVYDENRQLLANHAVHAGSIGYALLALREADKALVNDENFKLLAKNAVNAGKISTVLVMMYNACRQVNRVIPDESTTLFNQDFSLRQFSLSKPLAEKITKYLYGEREIAFNPEEIKMIKKCEWKSRDVIDYISRDIGGINDYIYLVLSFSNLISDKNVKLLAEHAAHAEGIDYALRIMHKADPTLVNDENFKLLANHAADAEGIGSALAILHKADPTLINDENFKLLANHAAHAKDIGSGLLALHRAGPALMTDGHFKLLANHAAHAEGIGSTLANLHEADPALVNDENRQLLANHAAHADGIGSTLANLHEADPALVNDENRQLLANHAAHVRSIGYALLALREEDKALVNDENFKLFAKNAVNAGKISSVLVEIFEECRQINRVIPNESTTFFKQDFSLSQFSLSKPLAEKITKYLCGEREIAFNPEEIKMIKKCQWEGRGINDYISLVLSLPDEAPGKRSINPPKY